MESPEDATTDAEADSESEPAAEPDPLEELVAAAQAEGELLVYAGMGEDALIATIEAFEAEYGIEVAYERKPQVPLIEQFETERAAGSLAVDVLQHDFIPHLSGLAQEGELADITDLPAIQTWPQEYVLENSYVLHSILPLSIQWNTQMVSADQAPASWEDLLDLPDDVPLAIIDPQVSGTFMALYKFMLDEYGEDFLRELGERKDFVAVSGAPGAQSVAAGEYGVFVGGTWDAMNALKAQGAPVDGVVPDFVTGAERWASVLADAPHPNAAKLFVNFLLADGGQQTVNGDPYNIVSPRGGVEGTQEMPARYQQMVFDIDPAVTEKIVSLLGL